MTRDEFLMKGCPCTPEELIQIAMVEAECDCSDDEVETTVPDEVAEKIARSYGLEECIFYGMSLREIEEELGEEDGALDCYLFEEDN